MITLRLPPENAFRCWSIIRQDERDAVIDAIMRGKKIIVPVKDFGGVPLMGTIEAES